MGDTNLGYKPDIECTDCGKKGIRWIHWGPLPFPDK